MSEQLFSIDALKFSDTELVRLSHARYLGMIPDQSTLDRVADGGAQAILSFGRDNAAQVFPEGILFDLTEKEKAELDALLSDQTLLEAIAFSEQLIADLGLVGRIDFFEVEERVRARFPQLNREQR